MDTIDSQSIENLVRRIEASNSLAFMHRDELVLAARQLIDAILAESGATADSLNLKRLIALQDRLRKIMFWSK